jgi:UDP-N-acetylmuramoyl-tripeptide--D-alanyl-D-alanine ligase
MNFDAQMIAQATNGEVIKTAAAGPVLTDTRSIDEGSWFLALVGERFDAHDFLGQVEGSLGVIVSQAPDSWRRGLVVVEDTTRALQNLGRFARSRLKGPVVGLTGSAGKTTTRAMVALALGELGEVHQTQGNLNNHLGVPMSLIAAPEACGAAVIEMGTSSHGEIPFLAQLVQPDVRLIVNIGAAHTEDLGGLQGVAREKGSLFATARPGDVLCVNADDPYVRALAVPDGVRVVTYGCKEGVEVRLLDAAVDGKAMITRAHYRTAQGSFSVNIPGLGEYLAHNGAAALAAAYALELDVGRAVQQLSAYQPVGMRMRIERLASGGVVFNDSYNANPMSMRASLQSLCQCEGRKVAVLADMMELGSAENALHEEIIVHALSLDLDRLILIGPRMSRAAKAHLGDQRLAVFDGPADASGSLEPWSHEGDFILLKGSRSLKVERILQELQSTHDC